MGLTEGIYADKFKSNFMGKFWLGLIGILAVSSIFFGESIDDLVRHAFFSSREPVLEIPLTADLKESVKIREVKTPIKKDEKNLNGKAVTPAPTVFVATSALQTAKSSTTTNEISQNSFNPQPAATSSPGATSSALQIFESQPETVPTPSPTSQASDPQYQHLMISEVMVGVEGNANYEFIELYNPTSVQIDLTGWSIKKKSSTGTESTLVASSRLNGKVVLPGKHFLTSGEGYNGAVAVDVPWPSSYTIAYTNNAIVLYNPNGKVEEVGWEEIPKNESLERKSWNTNEFLLQSSPNPQNSQN
ncbi:MAG: lamin tail domain-containing protein [Patescibacteria group bacterium]